ncbi:hypothetical protein Tco_1074030 [Tanacetum coccineum]
MENSPITLVKDTPKFLKKKIKPVGKLTSFYKKELAAEGLKQLYMADEEASTNFALMAFSDSESWSPSTSLVLLGKSFSRTTAPVSAARSFNTAVPFVNVAKPRTNAFQKSHSPLRRPFYQQTALKNRNLNNKVNTAKVISVNTVKGKRMTSAVGEQGINVVKPTAYWAWRPKIKMINHVYKNTGSCICKQFNYVDPTALAIPGQTATGKESSNPFMAGSLPKTISPMIHLSQKLPFWKMLSNSVDEESQKIGRQAQVMISDAEEYLISEDPVKQGRMEETENA